MRGWGCSDPTTGRRQPLHEDTAQQLAGRGRADRAGQHLDLGADLAQPSRGELGAGAVERDAAVKNPSPLPIVPPEAIFHAETPTFIKSRRVRLPALINVFTVDAVGPRVS